MRPMSTLVGSRPVYLGAGAALLTISGGAVALAAGQADAQSAIQMNLTPANSKFAQTVSIRGIAAPATPGGRLNVQFQASGTSTWRSVGSTLTGHDGRFSFSLAAHESGLLRVLTGASAAAEPALSASGRAGGTASGGAAAAPPADVGASTPQLLSVGAKLDVRARSLTVPAGHAARVNGRLLPVVTSRRVTLMVRAPGGWRAVAAARTTAAGRFSLPVPRRAAGRELRVSFAGDRLNRAVSTNAGRVTFALAMRPSVASWYDDGGATACGFHAQYGVANKSLPCGTKVTFRYGPRSVTAVVDDRGPYVDGREWDLNQNTAGALGFDGVATVYSSR